MLIKRQTFLFHMGMLETLRNKKKSTTAVTVSRAHLGSPPRVLWDSVVLTCC